MFLYNSSHSALRRVNGGKMEITWWIFFCAWIFFIPYSLYTSQSMILGRRLPVNFPIIRPFLTPWYEALGIIIALAVSYIHQIEWWWSLIFLLLMFFAKTLSTIFSVYVIWTVFLVVLYISEIIG